MNAYALSRNHSKPDGSNEKQQALCREVSSYSPDDTNLDHLTDAIKEIAQQKLQGIKTQQRRDSELNEMILHLESDQFPEDAAKAKKITLESSQYELLDIILYHNTPHPGTLCVVVPKDLRTDLLMEAHSGKFSGHLAE